jgi:hypothetical protein
MTWRSNWKSGFAPAKPWSAPIADYLAVGEANFPDGFTRSITALAVSDPDGDGPRESLLWIGYGDATRNLGTKTPIEFRYFVSPEDPGFRAARVLAGPPVTASADCAATSSKSSKRVSNKAKTPRGTVQGVCDE